MAISLADHHDHRTQLESQSEATFRTVLFDSKWQVPVIVYLTDKNIKSPLALMSRSSIGSRHVY
jgi:hypothetical protein